MDRVNISIIKTHTSAITLLMANIVREILIPQIQVDFRGWENRTCTRKLQLNLIQTSQSNNDASNETYRSINPKEF